MRQRAVSLSTAKAQLSALVNRVAHGGETFLIQSHGRPKAALMPLDRMDAGEVAARSARLRKALRAAKNLGDTIARRLKRTGKVWTPVVDDLRALRQRMAEPRR